MGLLDRLKGLAASTEDLERDRLSNRFGAATHGQVSLAELPLRERVRVVGEVSGLRVVPRAGSPSLEVTIDDGTGRAVAVFTGRKRIAGLDPGRAVALDGVARRVRQRTELMNP